MGRSANSFKRKEPRYKPQPRILVICEDEKSGKQYLEDATYHFRVKVDVEVTHCGNTDPRGIVAEAIRRQRDFDQVFCTIDRDTHETFDEAVRMAHKHPKIDLIVSYPCFEFWLLLHFGHSRKPYVAIGGVSAGDRLLTDLRAHPGMETYAKGASKNLFNSLLGEKFQTARHVAPKVQRDAEADKENNPSTQIYKLIEFFEKLSTPQAKY